MLLSGYWPHVERLTAANLAGVAAPAAAALTGVVTGPHGRFRSTNGTAVANGIAMVFICTHLDRRLPSNSIIVCFVSAQQCSSPILTDVLCHLFVQRTYIFLRIDNKRRTAVLVPDCLLQTATCRAFNDAWVRQCRRSRDATISFHETPNEGNDRNVLQHVNARSQPQEGGAISSQLTDQSSA